MKLIRTDQFGDIPAPCDFYGSCNPGFDDEKAKIFYPTITAANYNLEFTDDEMVGTDFFPLAMLECDGSYYRQNPNANFSSINILPQAIITPNPATATTVISLSGVQNGEQVRIKMTDVTGRLIDYFEVITNDVRFSKTIDVSHYPKGLVLVQVVFGKGITTTQKIIIQ